MPRGHMVKRSTGSWSIVLSLGNDPATGRRRRKWLTVRGTKRDAERELARLLTEHDRGISPATGRITVREYLSDWLRDVVAARNRPRTAENYASLVRNHIAPELGNILLSRLEPRDVERMLSGMVAGGLTANTAHHAFVTLSKALKDAIRHGLVSRNVCQAVDPPRPGRYEVDAPDPETVSKILRVAGETPHGPLFTFMAFTGVRRSEALGLRWQNVDLERAIASIVETAQRVSGKGIVFQPTKSAAGRRGIALDGHTVSLLRRHRAQQAEHIIGTGAIYDDQGMVFGGALGHPLDPDAVSHAFARVADRAGAANVRLHDLRHAHAAGLIKAGTHPRVVQERLGHSSAAFTMQVYGHVAAGLQTQAADAFAGLMADVSR